MRKLLAPGQFSRRQFATLFTAGVSALVIAQDLAAQGPATAKLKRIKMATVGVPDLTAAQAWYEHWLDYRLVERGVISRALAASWATPAMTGRPYVTLSPANGADVFVRLTEIDSVPNYKPLMSYGWNAIEITVQDADALQQRIETGATRIIGEARPLAPGSPLRAMQVLGPGGEVVYLTSHTGDRKASNHPEITTPIDRPFIMVLAGPDVTTLKRFYRDTFALGDQGDLSLPVGVLSDALKLPSAHKFSLSVLVMAERGNKLELDGLPSPAGPRPSRLGQLPPGVALTSFSVAKLSDIDVPYITPPQALYGTTRAASFIGPAGEITELIEDRAAVQ